MLKQEEIKHLFEEIKNLTDQTTLQQKVKQLTIHYQ